MAYTTINKSTDYFNTKLYEGNGSSPRSITGVGFQPDWTWTKNRDNTNGHGLFDAVRGYTTGKGLSTHNANAQGNADTYGYLSSRDSDGYTMTTGGSGMTMNNTNGESYVSWNWKANGQGSSNTAGSIDTTYTSVNTTAGFSISTYTGNGTSGATVGHGLGVAPSMVIVKQLNDTGSWVVYHKSQGATKFGILDTTAAFGTSSSLWNDTAPTNSVFYLGNDGDTNGASQTFVAYCFAEKTGYSKFGSYTGIADDDGAFVYTGFAPKFIMVKASTGSSTYSSWSMFDTARSFNENVGKTLYANRNYAEGKRGQGTSSTSSPAVDLLSNGFKFRKHADEVNNSNTTYIYMAIGQSLVGSNNIPATAR